MSQTLFRTIFPDTVLLFESGWNILLYESLKTNFYLKLNDFLVLLCKILIKFRKIQKFSKISILSFFSAPVANFVRIFNLDKIYRRTIPFTWHYFRCLFFPEMTSNWNLNVKNTFKFQFQNLSLTKMSQTSFRTISPDTVLLFESGWNILLYESFLFWRPSAHFDGST